jgi:hypothetical protein
MSTTHDAVGISDSDGVAVGADDARRNDPRRRTLSNACGHCADKRLDRFRDALGTHFRARAPARANDLSEQPTHPRAATAMSYFLVGFGNSLGDSSA